MQKTFSFQFHLSHKEGETPLFVACYNGYQENIKFLIENGADPTKKNEKQFTFYYCFN